MRIEIEMTYRHGEGVDIYNSITHIAIVNIFDNFNNHLNNFGPTNFEKIQNNNNNINLKNICVEKNNSQGFMRFGIN